MEKYSTRPMHFPIFHKNEQCLYFFTIFITHDITVIQYNSVQSKSALWADTEIRLMVKTTACTM